MTLMYDLLTSLHHPAMYEKIAVLQLHADLGSWPFIWLFAYGTELHTDRSQGIELYLLIFIYPYAFYLGD